MTDDRDSLIPPMQLPIEAVTAHLAVLTQAMNNTHQSLSDFRSEARSRDLRTTERLDGLASELDKIKRTALDPNQHMWVVVGSQRSTARSQRWSSRLTSFEAAFFYLLVVVIGGALLSAHHWLP